MIAEDHTILREGLRSLLSSNPHFEIVREAEDGHDAIRSAEKLKPDLVLMDRSMPKMDGFSPFDREPHARGAHFQPPGQISKRHIQFTDSPKAKKTPCLDFSLLLTLMNIFRRSIPRMMM